MESPELLIEHSLYHKELPITSVLNGVASQEGCDGPKYDLMVQFADLIKTQLNALNSGVFTVVYPKHIEMEYLTKNVLGVIKPKIYKESDFNLMFRAAYYIKALQNGIEDLTKIRNHNYKSLNGCLLLEKEVLLNVGGWAQDCDYEYENCKTIARLLRQNYIQTRVHYTATPEVWLAWELTPAGFDRLYELSDYEEYKRALYQHRYYREQIEEHILRAKQN